MSLREWLLAGLLMAGGTLHGAGPAVPVEGAVSQMARDGDGVVWAVPKEDYWAAPKSDQGVIACLEGRRWVTHRVKEVRETDRAMNLFLRPDGDVTCLWHNLMDPESWTLTLHRGQRDRIATTFRGKLNRPRLWLGTDGATLLTEQGRHLILFSSDCAQVFMAHIPDSMLLKPLKEPEPSAEPFYLPVAATQDFDHRWWLWCPENQEHEDFWRLGGIVSLTPTGRPYRMTRIANKDARISTMVPWDEQRLGVAVAGYGVLLLQTSDLSFSMLPGPEKNAFHYIEQIFNAGGDRCLIATPQPTKTQGDSGSYQPNSLIISVRTFYDANKPADVLWRQHGGIWEVVQRGLDEKPNFELKRPWLDAKGGLFLASKGGGDPWVISGGREPPCRLGAALGFPRGFISGLCEADSGHVLVLNSEGRSWLWPSGLRPAAGMPPFETIATVRAPVQASQGSVWCLHAGGTYARWDSDHWSDQSLPPELAKLSFVEFYRDDQDRGWLLSRKDESTKVGLLDMMNGQWRVFDSMHQALEAQLPKGVHWETDTTPFCDYTFSGDGRIGGYQHYGNEITLFEKGAWLHWKLHEVIGPQGQLGGTPFFSPGGAFSVPVYQGAIWQWTEGKWNRTGSGAVPHPLPYEQREEWEVSSGGQDHTFSSGDAVRDRWGVIWALEQNNELRKYLPGHDVPVFSQDQPQPLAHDRFLRRVLVDDSGHAFLDYQQYEDRHHVLHIPPKLLLPQLEGALAENHEDTVRFRLGNKATGETWYTWRLDHKEWQPVQTKPEVLIHPLAGGDHILEVRAFNAELTPDPKTASVHFRVDFNAVDLGDHLLAQLVSGGEAVDRNEVARSLIGLGASVLPQIKAAREKAPTSSAQWWLDAVIQQIERQKK